MKPAAHQEYASASIPVLELEQGVRVKLIAGSLSLQGETVQGARALLLAGTPLGEPISQYGPFVMNTDEEVEQAINDYNTGPLVA